MKFLLIGATAAMRLGEYPQPDIRGANPRNAHSDSTFSSHLSNDWTASSNQELLV